MSHSSADDFVEDEDVRVLNEDDEDAAAPEEATDAVVEEGFEVIATPVDASKYFIIPANDRMSSHRLSKFEYTSIISIRAESIARFGNCMVNITGPPDYLAEQELRQRKCPLCIKRAIGYRKRDGALIQAVEIWDPNDMEFPY
jgi:hypothetical protein